MNQNIKLLNEILFAIITYSLAMIFSLFFFLLMKSLLKMLIWICIVGYVFH